MAEKEPNWDKYMAGLTLRQLVDAAPNGGAFERISVYSPGREWLLLASLDIAVRTSDAGELKRVLHYLVDKYARSIREGGYQYKYAWEAHVEFFEVCSLLAGLDDEPEDYLDPDAVLVSLLKERLDARR